MAIIGVSGKARSGKNIFAEFLAEQLFKRFGQSYVLMAYAHELKCMVQREFDLSWEQLWGDDKEKEDKRYRKWTEKDEEVYWTGREIMQAYGEFYRSIDWNFWVKKLFDVIEEKEYNNVIVTDVRYPNEVDPILEKGGHHIRVTREVESKIHGKRHSSETSLDGGHKIDFSISNNGTLEDLQNTATEIANALIKLEKTKKN